jgi:hypothetical protein
MPKGGARKGAGRKKAQHTIETEAMRAFIVSKVKENLEPLLTAQLDLALGHLVQETDDEGGERVYSKSPDGKAIEYLLNQSIGKPTEFIEHSTPDDKPIKMTFDLTKATTDELLRFLTEKSTHSRRGRQRP